MTPKYYVLCGFPFQMMLVLSFLTQVGINFVERSYAPPQLAFIGTIGVIVCTLSMFRIYYAKEPKLITDGLFKYTRHPMYTGFLILSIETWCHHSTWKHAYLEPISWATMFLFVVGIFCAGYFQEKELLATYGQDAVDYYKRTPRFFLFYPFMRK